MNVVGISTAPPPGIVPAITPVPGATKTEAHPRHDQQPGKAPPGADLPRPPALKEPPVKPLSTLEMQVFLGSLPPDALFEGEQVPPKSSFDGYA